VQRYFIENSSPDSLFTIEGEDVHHMIRVMRMVEGDPFLAVFLDGKIAKAEITQSEETKVQAKIIDWIEEDAELPIRVAIASGLPKGDKLDLVVQKGTELGASTFIPFTASRSIVKLDDKKAVKRIERWTKIAKEASEQSHRSHIPEISSICTVDQLLKMSAPYTSRILAYEEEAKRNEGSRFKKELSRLKPGDSALIVFGPEGGLTEKEVEKFCRNGFIACGLGPRILRTETAPLYVLSAISYHFELRGD
jgi:16S rRNA (uracil1498-N3)-methyltransferase